jgi:type III secretion protein J
MLAILISNDIDAKKISGKKNTVNLTVKESQLAEAVQLLRRNGYPKDEFASVGTVFQKDGLISSPLEERVRYVYAVSQDLSETLSNLDGVLTARVHVVMPEGDQLNETPAKASVFIKHSPEVDLNKQIPKIKLLVNNSIDGLEYEKIMVALFPALNESKSSNPLLSNL